VPISYNGRAFHEGKKITWRDGVRALWALLKWGWLVRTQPARALQPQAEQVS